MAWAAISGAGRDSGRRSGGNPRRRLLPLPAGHYQGLKTDGPSSRRPKNLSLAYDGNEVIRDLSATIPPEQITALIGPNGSGKSTLAERVGPADETAGRGGLSRRSGHPSPAHAAGRPAFGHSAAASRSARRAYGPRVGRFRPLSPPGLFGHLYGGGRCEDRAGPGNHRHDGPWPTSRWASFPAGSGNWRGSPWRWRRTRGCCCWTSPPRFSTWPTSSKCLEVLERLHRRQQRTIVMVLHDVNQAARYAHHMIALVGGRIVCRGTPREVLTPPDVGKGFRHRRGSDHRFPHSDPVLHSICGEFPASLTRKPISFCWA